MAAGAVLRRLASMREADAHDEAKLDRVLAWLAARLHDGADGWERVMVEAGGAIVMEEVLLAAPRDRNAVVASVLARLLGMAGTAHLDQLLAYRQGRLWDALVGLAAGSDAHKDDAVDEDDVRRVRGAAWTAIASIGPARMAAAPAAAAALPILMDLAWRAAEHVNLDMANASARFLADAASVPQLADATRARLSALLGDADASAVDRALAILHGVARAGSLLPEDSLSYFWQVHALVLGRAGDPLSCARALDCLSALAAQPRVAEQLSSSAAAVADRFIAEPLRAPAGDARVAVLLAPLLLPHAPASMAALLLAALHVGLQSETAAPPSDAATPPWRELLAAAVERAPAGRPRQALRLSLLESALTRLSAAPAIDDGTALLDALPALADQSARRPLLAALRALSAGVGSRDRDAAVFASLARLAAAAPLDDRAFLAVADAVAARARASDSFARHVALHGMEFVERLLCDARWEVRDTAIGLLDSVAAADARAAAPLRAVVEARAADEEPYVRRRALHFFAAHAGEGDGALWSLATAAARDDSEALVRRAAVDLCAALDKAGAVSAAGGLSALLMALLSDADWETRLKAASWIAALPADRVDAAALLPALRAAADSAEALLRKQARAALLHVSPGEKLEDERMGEPMDAVTDAEIEALFEDVHACDNVLDCY